MLTPLTGAATAEWTVAREATELIGRYPDLKTKDLDRLIHIYPKLPIVQLALWSSDEGLAPRLEAFQKDHARRIRTPFRQYGALMIPVVLLAVVLLCTVVL